MIFSPQQQWASKAETLVSLREEGFPVPLTSFFHFEEWVKSPESVLQRIQSKFSEDTALAIRSSCQKEDSVESSNAGAFESILNVPLHPESIHKAIQEVFSSYGEPDSMDQVLIQPMLSGVKMSGVLMTRDLNDGAPYYTINYDDETGSTESVTSGNGVSKTVRIHRNFRNSDFDSTRLRQLLRIVRKLENHLHHEALDIEFAQDQKEQIWILQVRPIATIQHWDHRTDFEVTDQMDFLEEAFTQAMLPHSYLKGQTTFFANMPDWNPAEILGEAPRPLALSLYRELITKSIWQTSREVLGYKPFPSTELMKLWGARPYIDVRVSLNSFLPKGITEELSEKLVNQSLDYLGENPHFHDKIEFEVQPTIWEFGFLERWQEKWKGSFTADELQTLENTFREFTNQLLKQSDSHSLQNSLEITKSLSKTEAWSSNSTEFLGPMLQGIQTKGTLPFANTARHGFVAETLLRSAIRTGLIQQEEYEAFKESLHTVSSQYNEDFQLFLEKKQSKEEFLEKYGHLRPGTYDITSPDYHSSFSKLCNGSLPNSKTSSQFTLSKLSEEKLDLALNDMGLSWNSDEFFNYCKMAMESREEAKFHFTKWLSQLLELLADWGEQNSLDRDTLSWLEIQDFLNLNYSPTDYHIPESLKEKARENQERFKFQRSIQLGHFIRAPKDLYIVASQRSTPNFVTKKKCSEASVYLEEGNFKPESINGKIVVLSSADPGFDWIFSHNIAGLITQYGGTNSHMTIRCSEYGIPAAIGVGSVTFEKLKGEPQVQLDCETQQLILL